MGKKKEVKRIIENKNINVGVKKRRDGLIKKAHELAVLSDSEIAVIVFTNKGDLIKYSSTSNILGTLSRYTECGELYRQRKEQDDQDLNNARDVNKREMRIEEKQKLLERLLEMPPEVAAPVLQILRGQNPDLMLEGDEFELDVDVLDTETLWELERFLSNYKNMSKTGEQEQIENPDSDLKKAAKKIIEANNIKKKIAELQNKHSKLMGGDLSAVGLKEVLLLEQELTGALYLIRDRKEQILMGQLEKSTTKKNELMLEKDNLTKQLEELKGTFNPSKLAQPLCIEYLLPQSPVVNPNAKDNTETQGNINFEDNEPRFQLALGTVESVSVRSRFLYRASAWSN